MSQSLGLVARFRKLDLAGSGVASVSCSLASFDASVVARSACLSAMNKSFNVVLVLAGTCSDSKASVRTVANEAAAVRSCLLSVMNKSLAVSLGLLPSSSKSESSARSVRNVMSSFLSPPVSFVFGLC